MNLYAVIQGRSGGTWEILDMQDLDRPVPQEVREYVILRFGPMTWDGEGGLPTTIIEWSPDRW